MSISVDSVLVALWAICPVSKLIRCTRAIIRIVEMRAQKLVRRVHEPERRKNVSRHTAVMLLFYFAGVAIRKRNAYNITEKHCVRM